MRFTQLSRKLLTLTVALLSQLGHTHTQAGQSDWVDAFNVLWESRWQQSGILQSAYRWPNDEKVLRFSINPKATTGNADRVREVLGEILKEINFSALELPHGDDAVQLQFDIREYSDQERYISVGGTTMDKVDNWLFQKASVSLDEKYVYAVTRHELMHVLGFPGHPSRGTVLSYFERNQLSLKSLDRFMLKAWYSPTIRPGMAPLQVTRNLNRLWIDQNVNESEKENAYAVEAKWYSDTLSGLEDYAFNLKGAEPPTILYRSGRLNPEGLKRGLAALQAILGDAYLFGSSVDKNPSKAVALYQLSASNGNVSAASYLARRATYGSLPQELASKVCGWIKDTPLEVSKLGSKEQTQATESEFCKKAMG